MNSNYIPLIFQFPPQFYFPHQLSLFKTMSKIALARKLRILCLHGYFQDGALMKENSCALYRKLKDIADFCKS